MINSADFRRSRGGRTPGPGRVRFVLLVVLLAVSAAVAGVLPDLTSLSARLPSAGPLGPLVAVALTALLVLAMVPRSVVAAGAGLLYGASTGSTYVVAGTLIGAVVAFEVGRRLGRDFLRGRQAVTAADRILERHGMWAVLISRLVPVAPFGLVSYAFGVRSVRRLPFLVASAVGIGPSTVIFATLGANAMRPTSPAFIASILAAVSLGTAGMVATRVAIRRNRRK